MALGHAAALDFLDTRSTHIFRMLRAPEKRHKMAGHRPPSWKVVKNLIGPNSRAKRGQIIYIGPNHEQCEKDIGNKQ